MPGRSVRVLSYSGYRGDESPRAFFLDGEKIVVDRIVDMWIEKQGGGGPKRFFKVKGVDGFTYVLSYDEVSKKWFLEG